MDDSFCHVRVGRSTSATCVHGHKIVGRSRGYTQSQHGEVLAMVLSILLDRCFGLVQAFVRLYVYIACLSGRSH